MEEIYIHQNALKHGLTEEEIISAWNNRTITKNSVDESNRIMTISYSNNGKLLELIATRSYVGEYLIFHAFSPPTKKFMRELGFRTGR